MPLMWRLLTFERYMNHKLRHQTGSVSVAMFLENKVMKSIRANQSNLDCPIVGVEHEFGKGQDLRRSTFLKNKVMKSIRSNQSHLNCSIVGVEHEFGKSQDLWRPIPAIGAVHKHRLSILRDRIDDNERRPQQARDVLQPFCVLEVDQPPATNLSLTT